jgi:hypothetical protein
MTVRQRNELRRTLSGEVVTQLAFIAGSKRSVCVSCFGRHIRCPAHIQLVNISLRTLVDSTNAESAPPYTQSSQPPLTRNTSVGGCLYCGPSTREATKV